MINFIAPAWQWVMENRFEIERLFYNFKEYVL